MKGVKKWDTMNNKIKVLPSDVVGKIAAGEVVERPASVVKELVENSIDAGSGSITIDIENAGTGLIRVSDNGTGMSSEDVKVSCMPHSTSKIEKISDLEHLFTLGFRGEALSSITSVSQTDIITRAREEDVGTYVYIESGEVLKVRPKARPVGTTVEIRNLFYNVPARRKFLKKAPTELAQIVNITGRFIISRPDIEFKLLNSGRTLLHAGKGTGLVERIRLVMGKDIADNMFPVSGSGAGVSVEGYVTRPAYTRKDRKAQMFFVNRRFIHSRAVSDSMNSAFHSMLERGRFPGGVLFFEISPEKVDINIHPAKLLAKFEDEKFIRELTERTIKQGFERIKRSDNTITGDKALAKTEDRSLQKDPLGSEAEESQEEFKYDYVKKGTAGYMPRTGSMAPVFSEVKARKEENLFQFNDSYIVQMSEDAVRIIDQHAAHERVLYEFFSNASQNGRVERQNLLFPVRFDLSPSEQMLMERMLPHFGSMGFNIEDFGNRSYVVQSVPAFIKDSDIRQVILDVLHDMKKVNYRNIEPVEEIVKRTACRAAIKAGDPMTRQEMLSLLRQLYDCELPFTCPHGRPVVINITLAELEKRFHRK